MKYFVVLMVIAMSSKSIVCMEEHNCSKPINNDVCKDQKTDIDQSVCKALFEAQKTQALIDPGLYKNASLPWFMACKMHNQAINTERERAWAFYNGQVAARRDREEQKNAARVRKQDKAYEWEF